jgi:hypothetical protein
LIDLGGDELAAVGKAMAALAADPQSAVTLR